MKKPILLITFCILVTSCSNKYERLAIQHKKYCKNHIARDISVKKDGKWVVYCVDGFITIAEEEDD